MTLATRMSLFFLAALAVVLVGLSAAIYVLVRSHLFHQVDERLVAGIETFRSATEFEPNGLEWEPNQRRIFFIEAQSVGPMIWGVFEETGRQVDGSGEAVSLFAEHFQPSHSQADGPNDIIWRDQTWRILRQTLRSYADPRHPVAANSDDPNEKPTKRYSALVLLIGVPLDPALRPLQSLLLALMATSVAIWLFAAAMGRWLCAKALSPMTRMARSARSISAADLSRRLPPPGTHDELEDLWHAFNDLLTRLEVSFQRQQRFTAEASHQLRTPLTAMLGQLDVALRRDRNPDEYRRALESVHRQAGKLRQIVEMLLFLTREDADAAPLQCERLELRSWLADHLHSWQHHSRRDDMRIESDTDGPLWVVAHGELLAQAVDNLLDNACIYSQPGSPIVVRTGRQENRISITVEDGGCGIAAADLPHVFDPFFRSVEARRRGIAGTGLGLAVARRLVAAMSGAIEVTSTVGEGSRFTIVLAVSPQEELAAPTAAVANV